MANQIDRDAFVTRDVLKNPISYVRGTDLIPIVIHFRDFQIPSGATARVFVAKSDGNAVYTTATIDGNDVTIDVQGQMFIELGTALMQISIMDGDEELCTFVQPVNVEPNLKAGDFPASGNDITFLDDAIEQANQAVNTATTAAQKASAAVQNANTAISNANKAISDLNAQIATLENNFASLAQTVEISQLQTVAKTLAGAVNELNSKTLSHTYLLSGSGWKRVLKFEGVSAIAAGGAIGYGGIIIIRTSYMNDANMYDLISFASRYHITAESSFIKLHGIGNEVVTKIRHTIDSKTKTAYIEIYYSSNLGNRVNISFPSNNNANNQINNWIPTNGESTEETVEGVTVVSSLDLTS